MVRVNIVVAILVGKTVVCTYMVRSYLVSMQGHVMPTKLVNFKTGGFGVTLAMGWISIYSTCVD
jgi:hypothetical protein